MNDFLSVLDGLERADRLPEIFSSASVESNLLRKCVVPKSKGGQFPDMSSAISHFRNAFDAGSSKKKGIIELKPGVDTVFDGIKVGIEPAFRWCCTQNRESSSAGVKRTFGWQWAPRYLHVVQ